MPPPRAHPLVRPLVRRRARVVRRRVAVVAVVAVVRWQTTTRRG
jgi:hypothetical protein